MIELLEHIRRCPSCRHAIEVRKKWATSTDVEVRRQIQRCSGIRLGLASSGVPRRPAMRPW